MDIHNVSPGIRSVLKDDPTNEVAVGLLRLWHGLPLPKEMTPETIKETIQNASPRASNMPPRLATHPESKRCRLQEFSEYTTVVHAEILETGMVPFERRERISVDIQIPEDLLTSSCGTDHSDISESITEQIQEAFAKKGFSSAASTTTKMESASDHTYKIKSQDLTGPLLFEAARRQENKRKEATSDAT